VQTQETPPSTELIREFVIAGHGNLDRVKQMLGENPLLLNASYQWNENDRETAIQAAAQVGSSQVARFLLEKGALLEICTAAMLGERDEVERRLKDDPRGANATGAHGIPLLPHAVWSGDLGLVQLVYKHGAESGATLALHNAVVKSNYEIAEWLLKNPKPDVCSKNFQGKTPLRVATERKDERMVQLLREYGAKN
jgi:uncharacterized protein